MHPPIPSAANTPGPPGAASGLGEKVRDLAKIVLRAKGSRIIWIHDGVMLWLYGDDQIRVALQPAIAGASMPSLLDIRGTGPMTLFSMQWYARAGDGQTEVLTYKPGDWEDALRRAAGVGADQTAVLHAQRAR